MANEYRKYLGEIMHHIQFGDRENSPLFFAAGLSGTLDQL
jgi:hypothetical protein